LRHLTTFFVAVALLTVLPAAAVMADSLPVNGTLGGAPSAGSLPAGAPTASIVGAGYTLKDVSNVTKGTGTYDAMVWRPDTGTGFTTVALDVHVTTGLIATISLGDFDSFTTDVVAVGVDGTHLNASDVSRSSDGSTVTFSFRPDVAAGQNSATFVIRTNAPSYGGGSIQFIDGGTATAVGFAPAVPLPATANMGLVLLGGVGGLGALRRLKNGKNVVA